MNKNLSNFSQAFVFLALITASFLLSLVANLSGSVLDGINLFVACVLPSVFPYFFITTILSSLKITSKISGKLSPLMRVLFKQNGIVGYAFFMSVLAGYPMGAKIVSDLKNDNLITENQAKRAFMLCSTSSPMFLISSVGSIMFKSSLFGILLLACNFLSAITLGIITSLGSKSTIETNTLSISSPLYDNLINDSVYSAVNSTLFVGGMITLFYVFTEILALMKVLAPIESLFTFIFNSPSLGKGLTFGLIEYTKGLKIVSSGNMGILTLPISAFICGFGGLSVIMQSVAFIKSAKIKIAPFLLGKILGAIINFIFGLIFSLIFLF